jgi:hypothetical protein
VETSGVGAALKNRDRLAAIRRRVSNFKTELGEYLGNKTFLIGLPGMAKSKIIDATRFLARLPSWVGIRS